MIWRVNRSTLQNECARLWMKLMPRGKPSYRHVDGTLSHREGDSSEQAIASHDRARSFSQHNLIGDSGTSGAAASGALLQAFIHRTEELFDRSLLSKADCDLLTELVESLLAAV
jgi:hypothetical protein